MLNNVFAIDSRHPKSENRAFLRNRSAYRQQFDETYRHRAALNSFLIQLRSHELRHSQKEKMPICSRFFSLVFIKHKDDKHMLQYRFR